MSILRRKLLLGALAVSLGSVGVGAHAQADKKDLVVGVTAGSNSDQWKLGIVPLLQKKGYKIKLVEFNDYVQPNFALAQGSIDANFFQHRVYLQKFALDQKLDLAEVVQGPIAPLGAYSTKRKTLAELKDGDRVSLPNDPSNLARALLLLEQNKLVTLKSGIDPLRASEKDIAENPRKLKLIPLEAAQLPRSMGDVEYAIITGNFAVSSGLKLTDAVVLEKTADHYLNVVAVKKGNETTQWAKDITEAYKSKEFNAIVDKHFPGYAKPSFLK